MTHWPVSEDLLAEEHFQQSRRLAGIYATRAGITGGLVDVEGAADLALAEACRRWRPDNGTSFKTFLAQRVRYRVLDELRAETHFRPGRGRTLVQVVSLEGLIEGYRKRCSTDLRPGWMDPAAPSEDEDLDAWERCERLFDSGLTKHEHEVLCVMLLCDGRQDHAAEVLELTPSAISLVVRNIRKVAGAPLAAGFRWI